MSSTVVRKVPEESDESLDDSRWIVSNDTPLTGWTDPDTWLDTTHEHVDVVSDAGIVVPASRHRAKLQGSRDRDLVDGYFDEPDALIENYASWKLVEANVTYGSGIPRPIAEVSDDDLLW
jgi:hypothetical protein